MLDVTTNDQTTGVNSAMTADVVIVGARAAGSSLAIHLARQGRKVVAVDKATFPSPTMSTHVIYPNTLARLEDLGVLAEIEAHAPPPLYTAWYHENRMFVAPHTPERGRDWAICVRRVTLDDILVRAARSEGATVLEGHGATGFLGAGTPADPLRGLTCRTPEGGTLTIDADIVIGADGVNSALARHLGLDREKVMPTETMLYYAYWTGVDTRNTQDFFFECPWVCAHFPADDGHHVITMNGPADARKDIDDLQAFYLAKINSIPALASRLKGATQVSRVTGTTRLDGFYRQHTGPGWALVGDAAHFKHPASAQGICDALHGAEVLAAGIEAGDWMSSYPAWREAESPELYAFCKHLREAPSDEAVRGVMDAMIADAHLARKLVDVWARSSKPWTEVIPHVPGMADVTGLSVAEVLSEFSGNTRSVAPAPATVAAE
ncbi:MAG: NAD(P)/FAD-dependent oxidoreductase [Roseicyclus sp.]